MVLALCLNGQTSEQWANLAFEKHNLKQVRIMRNSAPFFEYKTTSNTQVYYKTFQNLRFDQEGPMTKLENYKNQFYLVFDLASTQRSNQEIYLPEVVRAPIALIWISQTPQLNLWNSL